MIYCINAQLVQITSVNDSFAMYIMNTLPKLGPNILPNTYTYLFQVIHKINGVKYSSKML